MSLAETFDAVYRENAWGGTESRSGPGSSMEATTNVRFWLQRMYESLSFDSVLDIGCGESTWWPWPKGFGPRYLGLDVSEEALSRNPWRRHESTARGHQAALVMPREADLEPADMVILRHVIQHLPIEEGSKLLERVPRPTWLLATTYIQGTHREGFDLSLDTVARGGGYFPDMTAPVFRLGQPQVLIRDNVMSRYDCHLGLWRLA